MYGISKLTKTGYELEDVNIIQAPISHIRHRSECDPMIDICGIKAYPVIVAPMGAVTDENNYKIWLKNNFICVVPRTVNLDKRLEICTGLSFGVSNTFASFSLKEAEDVLMYLPVYDESNGFHYKRYVCIDLAHGTMSALYDVCKALKTRYGNNMVIMTGNVATPDAYPFYADAGIDYMRCSIGQGSRCTTSCNVGVHYPSATLLDDLRVRRDKFYGKTYGSFCQTEGNETQIILDGGISNFDDIQKALCLGADAVMSGSIFAKAEEACEQILLLNPDNPDVNDAIPFDKFQETVDFLMKCDDDSKEFSQGFEKIFKRKPYRVYYGMSTKFAQTKTGGNGTTTSEGIIKPIPVEYPIAKWAENMASYLRSCMSYTGCKTIKELKEDTELIINLSGDKSFRK